MVTFRVGKGDVADAAIVEMLQVFQFTFNRRTVLHAQRQRNFSAAKLLLYIGCGVSHGELVRRAAHQSFHIID